MESSLLVKMLRAGATCALTNETWFYKMEATLWDAMPLVALKIFTAQVGLEWSGV